MTNDEIELEGQLRRELMKWAMVIVAINFAIAAWEGFPYW